MRKFLSAVVLSLCSAVAVAKPVSLNVTKLELSRFLDGTYGELLRKNFVIAPQLLSQDRKVSLRVTLEDSELAAFLATYLDQLGIEQKEERGVLYFGPKGVRSDVSSLSAPLPLAPASYPPAAPSFGVQHPAPLEPPPKPSVEVYTPVSRTGEFVCAFVVALHSPGTCHVAGPVVLLKLSPEDLAALKPVLEKVDTVAGRVRINATFVEVTSTGRDGFGLSLVGEVLGAQVGVTVGSPAANAALSIRGRKFSAVLDAIKRDGRFKQIASPSGAVTSGERFSIVTGEEVPTLGDVQLDNRGNATQGVVYRPAGVILDVLPRVVRGVSGNRIEAAIKAQVSSFVPTTTGVNGSPTLSKREVQTVQSMEDGDVVVIGGLNSSRTTNSKSSLFGLPFGHADQSDVTELVLLLSASVE